MKFKTFALGFAWRAALVLGLLIAGVALGLYLTGKVKLPGLGAILGGAMATGLGGMAAAKKGAKNEIEALDKEVEDARRKAEEEELAKIEDGGDALDRLSRSTRERIAKAGRDAVARVLARQGR